MALYLWAQTDHSLFHLDDLQTLQRATSPQPPLQQYTPCCKPETSITGDPVQEEMSHMLQTLEFNEDLQARFTVLFGWTTQNLFKVHMCNTDCVIWIRQSTGELRDCGKRSCFRQCVTSVSLYLQCTVAVGTWAHVAVNQTLKKEEDRCGWN